MAAVVDDAWEEFFAAAGELGECFFGGAVLAWSGGGVGCLRILCLCGVWRAVRALLLVWRGKAWRRHRWVLVAACRVAWAIVVRELSASARLWAVGKAVTGEDIGNGRQAVACLHGRLVVDVGGLG